MEGLLSTGLTPSSLMSFRCSYPHFQHFEYILYSCGETTRVLTVRKAEVRSRMFIVLDWPTDLQDCVGSI